MREGPKSGCRSGSSGGRTEDGVACQVLERTSHHPRPAQQAGGQRWKLPRTNAPRPTLSGHGARATPGAFHVHRKSDLRSRWRRSSLARGRGKQTPSRLSRAPSPPPPLAVTCRQNQLIGASVAGGKAEAGEAAAAGVAAGGGGGGGMAAAAGPGARTKTKKKHFVPQRVKVLRSADPLLGVLGWGINHQINELSQVPQPVMLLPDDFKANSKIKVNNHLFNRENLPGHFKFKEYCPQVFRNLRERFNIDDQDYQVSLTRSPPTYETEGGGRFLLSYDRTLVIKEISSEDVADVHSLLSHYHQYIVKCHGSTLLPQFLGMYRLSVDSEESYMMVMRNMFSHRLTVHRKYDLKGSLVSREASDKEKGKELPTLKDIDFLNMNQKVYISEEAKRDFMEKLKRDVEFLVQLKIMGYSLLLGIHDVQRAEQEDEEEVKEEEEDGEGEPVASVGSYGTSPEGIGSYLNSHKPLGPGDFDPYIDVYAIKSAENSPQKEVYFMGLIDILTQYDAKKKAAHAAKTVKHGAGAEISTVHPEQYAKRFLDFVTNIFA